MCLRTELVVSGQLLLGNGTAQAIGQGVWMVDQDLLTIAGEVTSDSDSEHSSTTSAVPGSARAIEHYLRMVDEDPSIEACEVSSESDFDRSLTISTASDGCVPPAVSDASDIDAAEYFQSMEEYSRRVCDSTAIALRCLRFQP